MAFDLGSLGLGNILSALPSSNEVANQLVTGAVVSTILAGAKSPDGQNALDPLHIFHQQTPAGSTMVVGKTMPISAFNQLDAAGKQAVMTAGYSLVNG